MIQSKVDSSHSGPRRFFFGERMAKALMLAGMLLVVMGWLRPDKPKGMSPHAFWMEKAHWRHCADMVILGDSRSNRGVSPAVLETHCSGRRIRNYGFDAGGFSLDYFQAASEVLDPLSSRRSALLAITPRSLTLDAAQSNLFYELQKKKNNRLGRFCTRYFSRFVDFFEPMSFRDAWFGLCPAAMESHTVYEYFADGWVASDHIPPSRREVRGYAKYFATHRVNHDIVKLLMQQVRQWSHAGITVYAFRMPTDEKMFELENNASGFDEAGFVRSFEEAGGVWLTVNPTAYACYDGSHLRCRDAEQFSSDLGRLIVAAEPSWAKPLHSCRLSLRRP